MPKITDISQLDLNQAYSYADYLTWQFDERVELFKGKFAFLETPNAKHQAISAHLTGILGNFFKRKAPEIFHAPFDVRLYNRNKYALAGKDIHTVVQPDLCVICNPELLDQRGCNGAPDWIIEILSKGTAKRDMQIKYELYQENGVQEYWIVYPNDQAVHQFILDDNERYQLKHMYTDDDMVTPHLFPDLAIGLTEIFETWQEQ